MGRGRKGDKLGCHSPTDPHGQDLLLLPRLRQDRDRRVRLCRIPSPRPAVLFVEGHLTAILCLLPPSQSKGRQGCPLQLKWWRGCPWGGWDTVLQWSCHWSGLGPSGTQIGSPTTLTELLSSFWWLWIRGPNSQVSEPHSRGGWGLC